MVFSSIAFLSIFLPIVFLLNLVIRNIKFRNAILMVASLVFYAYGEPAYVLLMILSALWNYLLARGIAKGKGAKGFLVLAVCLNIGTLILFKYTGMLVQTFNTLTGLSIPVPQIRLPIGISFFTFQALSYVIDVYRGETEVQKNYFRLLLYISFFPQLIAGPIVKYRDISDQITDRTMTLDKAAEGLRRFVCGLAKKVLIANTMGRVADMMFASGTQELSILTAWLGAVCYLFQIYYDFSGYSDMAIGLGRMFGFTFKENFNYPYTAGSIQDFWRRWHISLSTWFKEYLYIPLGGNRKGKARTDLNKIFVFLMTGLWHGANWTFVIWGLWHGLFLLLEAHIPMLRKLPKGINKLYTLLVVVLGFVMFRADTISYGIGYIGRMFTFTTVSRVSISLALEQLTPWFIGILTAAIIGCGPIGKLSGSIKEHVLNGPLVQTKWKVVDLVLYFMAFLGLVFCMFRLSSGAYNPFIYFRF